MAPTDKGGKFQVLRIKQIRQDISKRMDQMNEHYTVTVMTANGDIDQVYDGKWRIEAIKAGQDALTNDGCFMADLNVYDGTNLVRIENIAYPI